MSFISSKFVAIEEFFFEHPSYVVFLQITYLAMAFEYMAKNLAMVFWDDVLGAMANLAAQW